MQNIYATQETTEKLRADIKELETKLQQIAEEKEIGFTQNVLEINKTDSKG